MAVKIRCTSCRGAFPWNTKEHWPKFCPLCSADLGDDRADDDIVMPFIRSSSSKLAAADRVYREMEESSSRRAQAAADMVGAPVSEMSGLKITDMRDNQRPGDLAVPLPSNPVSDFMQQNPQASGFGTGRGVEYSMAVQQGPLPNAGARTRTMVQSLHQDMVSQHCVGIDADTRRAVRPSIDVVSERPGNETYQPGYRRRG